MLMLYEAVRYSDIGSSLNFQHAQLLSPTIYYFTLSYSFVAPKNENGLVDKRLESVQNS